MDNTLPLSVIQRDIRRQLELSRSLFNLIDRLASVAGHEDNPARTKKELEQVMGGLLTVGKSIVNNASQTGDEIVKFVSAA